MSRLFLWGEPMCAKDFAFLFSRLGICLAPGMTPIWPKFILVETNVGMLV